jgi:hypothetical protein
MDSDELDWNPEDARAVGVPLEPSAPSEPGRTGCAFPEPVPATFTTIASRLGHVILGVLAPRNGADFGARAASYEIWEYAGRAATALDQLEPSSTAGWPWGAARGSTRPGLGRAPGPVGAKEPLHRGARGRSGAAHPP